MVKKKKKHNLDLKYFQICNEDLLTVNVSFKIYLV